MKNIYSVLFLLFTFFSITAYSEEAEVRIGYSPNITSLPAIYVAQEKKLFENQGIKVSYQLFQSGNEMINALIAGKIDLLQSVPLIPILQLEENYPNIVRVVSHSRVTRDNPFDALIVSKKSSIATLNDLKGKKIGVYPGTTATIILKEFLKKNNVDSNNISIIPLVPSIQIQSLSSNAIDVLYSYEPILTIALSTGEYKELFHSVLNEFSLSAPMGVMVISRDFEKSNTELSKKVINIIDSSISYIRKNPEEARNFLVKNANVSEQVAKKVHLVDMSLSSEVDVNNLQEFINIFVGLGEVKGKIDAQKLIK